MSELKPCRESFEKWCASVGEPAHMMKTDEVGQYESHVIFCQWHAWRAAWNTRAVNPAVSTAVKALEELVNNHGFYTEERYALAVEALAALKQMEG